MKSSVYTDCEDLLGIDAEVKDLLKCVSSSINSVPAGALSFSRSVLLVVSAALVFFMQAGFAM
jgi:hypothetical protein